MRCVSIKRAIVLGYAAISMQVVNAGVPNNSHPTTFLGPTLKGAYTSTLNRTTAYSVAGEAGLKNFRVAGTLGWEIENNQRLKFSAEYLWQQFKYPFFSGDQNKWTNQGAVGADYQYDLGSDYNPQFNFNVYLTHAPNQNLSSVSGTYISQAGTLVSYVDPRNVAGSNSVGVSPGVSTDLWHGTKVGADLNYDYVRYKKNTSPSQDAQGLGGTLHLNQVLSKDAAATLLVAIRQPFNNYQANLAFVNVPNLENWIVGIDGAYTTGKNSLPDSYNIGVSFGYQIDQECDRTPHNFKDQLYHHDGETIYNSIVSWVAKSAAYVPTVLAIAE